MLDGWLHSTKGHCFNLLPILILWYLWKARNEAKHENIKMEASLVINNIKRKMLQLYNYKIITFKTFSRYKNLARISGINVDWVNSAMEDSFIVWRKPKTPFVKLNTDGMVGLTKAGVGGLIRDCNGNILVAFVAPLQQMDVLVAELYALLFGLELCIKNGRNCVWIEVDSLWLVQIIRDGFSGNAQCFYIIRKIKLLLKDMKFEISHIFREGNGCAYWLAKKGAYLNDYEEVDTLNLDTAFKGLLMMDISALPHVRYG
ncbi:Putative ribonuclease H protein [Dendrobium catenatum]|uniref:Ribonuclease H protein n=1 Tax=Dendrobium catenatum TaxID=906689 RepID=A0A2I0V757_9ASPA|nr:Putative ribonuclease H protein [Dendrobium catenatum]